MTSELSAQIPTSGNYAAVRQLHHDFTAFKHAKMKDISFANITSAGQWLKRTLPTQLQEDIQTYEQGVEDIALDEIYGGFLLQAALTLSSLDYLASSIIVGAFGESVKALDEDLRELCQMVPGWDDELQIFAWNEK